MVAAKRSSSSSSNLRFGLAKLRSRSGILIFSNLEIGGAETEKRPVDGRIDSNVAPAVPPRASPHPCATPLRILCRWSASLVCVLSLCLSRACLGKMIVSSIQWHRKRDAFSDLCRWNASLPGRRSSSSRRHCGAAQNAPAVFKTVSLTRLSQACLGKSSRCFVRKV